MIATHGVGGDVGDFAAIGGATAGGDEAAGEAVILAWINIGQVDGDVDNGLIAPGTAKDDAAGDSQNLAQHIGAGGQVHHIAGACGLQGGLQRGGIILAIIGHGAMLGDDIDGDGRAGQRGLAGVVARVRPVGECAGIGE